MGFAYEIHKAELLRDKERQQLREQGFDVPKFKGSTLVGELPHHSPGMERFLPPGKIEVTVTENAVVESTVYRAGNNYMVPIKHAVDLFQQGRAVETKKLVWDFWGAPGRILAAEPCEARPHSTEPTDGALRIASGCVYDPGNAAYRYHTAFNECTKHASTFIRFRHTNPFCDLRQIDGDTDLFSARAAVYNADVLHSHVDYALQGNTGFKWRVRNEQLVVRHYHGTRPSGTQWPNLNMLEDDLANAALVGARLTLCATRPGRIHWLPIPVPVRRYRALVAKKRRPGPFRIAHSPSRRDYKGTADLEAAVEIVRKKGLLCEIVMIEKKQHDEALRIKADADMTFDSFWLGMQGSGLEGAAMGQMVVAGDESVKALYETMEDRDGKRYVGYCPYTFADNRIKLVEVIERAISDVEWYKAEARRVAKYTMEFHDYAAVARRFENIIHLEAPQLPNVFTKRGKAA